MPEQTSQANALRQRSLAIFVAFALVHVLSACQPAVATEIVAATFNDGLVIGADKRVTHLWARRYEDNANKLEIADEWTAVGGYGAVQQTFVEHNGLLHTGTDVFGFDAIQALKQALKAIPHDDLKKCQKQLSWALTASYQNFINIHREHIRQVADESGDNDYEFLEFSSVVFHYDKENKLFQILDFSVKATPQFLKGLQVKTECEPVTFSPTVFRTATFALSHAKYTILSKRKLDSVKLTDAVDSVERELHHSYLEGVRRRQPFVGPTSDICVIRASTGASWFAKNVQPVR